MVEAGEGKRRRRRRRWPWVLLALVLFIVFVPWIPYSPYCRYDNFRKLEGKLSDAFREAMTKMLHAKDVPFVEIGGVILLRFRDWGYQTGFVSIAQDVAIISLVYEKFGADVDAIPEHVKAFRSGDNKYDERDCDFIRAVAIEWETGPQAAAD